MISTNYGSISSIVAREEEEKIQLQLIVTIVLIIKAILLVIFMWLMIVIVIRKTQKMKLSYREEKCHTLGNLIKLIRDSDVTCKSELHMNKCIFNILCEIVRDTRGLTDTKNMPFEEIIAMFLYTFCLKIGQYEVNFIEVEKVYVSSMQLLKKPTPITEDCEDSRWKCFKAMQLLCLIPNKHNYNICV